MHAQPILYRSLGSVCMRVCGNITNLDKMTLENIFLNFFTFFLTCAANCPAGKHGTALGSTVLEDLCEFSIMLHCAEFLMLRSVVDIFLVFKSAQYFKRQLTNRLQQNLVSMKRTFRPFFDFLKSMLMGCNCINPLTVISLTQSLCGTFLVLQLILADCWFLFYNDFFLLRIFFLCYI